MSNHRYDQPVTSLGAKAAEKANGVFDDHVKRCAACGTQDGAYLLCPAGVALLECYLDAVSRRLTELREKYA